MFSSFVVYVVLIALLAFFGPLYPTQMAYPPPHPSYPPYSQPPPPPPPGGHPVSYDDATSVLLRRLYVWEHFTLEQFADMILMFYMHKSGHPDWVDRCFVKWSFALGPYGAWWLTWHVCRIMEWSMLAKMWSSVNSFWLLYSRWCTWLHVDKIILMA